ncbi:MAG: nucleoside phosphorylase [Flavobacteriales bacterium]|nr:nucleoside phosphorylase [Flavobacteriales bacterium]
MRTIGPTELILNPDGSIYHINLKPEHIAPTVIFVGDQNRVEKVAKHFDEIEFSTQKREFKTIVGNLKGKRFTVISTGIGPDNIDIVLNEIDALVNIDLETRTVKPELTSLQIVRMGTSGSLHEDIPVDAIVLGTHGLGLDGVLHSYDNKDIFETELENAFIDHCNYAEQKSRPYIVRNSPILEKKMMSDEIFSGITATAGGFFGPQGRILRLALQDNHLNKKIETFRHNQLIISNLEMETSVIYGLSKLMGHQAVSMNAIIGNRANLTFSKDPYATVEKMIAYSLDKLTA